MGCCHGSNAVYFEKVISDWSDTTVIWNNQPATTTTARIWMGPSTSTTENVQVDLASFAQEWVDNPFANYGMKMLLENEQYYRSRNYASEDHSNASIRPKLVITYTVPTPFVSTAPVGSYQRMADSLLHHLDKSGVTTGILYDRVMPLAGLHAFGTQQPDTSARAHFFQAYSEMFNASYDTSAWLTSEDIRDLALYSELQEKVPIGLANFQFNVIDTSSIDLGLIEEIDSMYYDVPNRPRHPFLIKSTFLASPLVDSASGLTVTYELASALTVNKSDKTISSLQIDFGNGAGLVNVSLTGSATVTYPGPGWKTLKFVAGFSNGTNAISYAVMKVRPGQAPLPLGECDSGPTLIPIESELSFQGYDEATATTGKGNYKIFYADSNCDEVIRKPIIVVDGFDPGDEDKPDVIYDERLNKSEPGKQGFAKKLRSLGYDIIILNFPRYQIGTRTVTIPFPFQQIQIPEIRDGGADYIERNARVLMTLIDKINEDKEGTEELIIIGPSMGGLISQYALAYMEDIGEAHNTKLWVSFDTPHKGANVPLGDQHFLDFYASESKAAKENLNNKINSVAAKQMLLNHYLAPNFVFPTPNFNGFTFNHHYFAPAGAPNFHQRFYNDLNALGFPEGDVVQQQPFRKIALVNGSLGGIEVNDPCERGFLFEARYLIKEFLFLFKVHWENVTLGTAKMYFTPSYGNSCTVFDGSFMGIGRTVNIQMPSGTSGFDVAPGGTYNTQEKIQTETPGIIGSAFKYADLDFFQVKPNHSFINTKSALAFTGSNTNLSENLSNRNLVCTGETPFDSYFGQINENTEHVTIWPEAGNWLFGEIVGNPFHTTYMSGPNGFCGTATYKLQNLPLGYNVTWQLRDGNDDFTFVGSNTGLSVTITTTQDSDGDDDIEAIVTDACTHAVVTSYGMSIYGKEEPYLENDIIDGPSGLVSGYGEQFGFNEVVPEAIGYEWYAVEGGMTFTNLNSTGNLVNIDSPWNGYYHIGVRILTPCGTLYSQEKLVQVYGGDDYMFSISPNPTTGGEIEVTAKKAKNEQDARKSNSYSIDAEIKLYNKHNRLLSTHRLKNGKAIISTKNLPNDMYIINIINGDTVESHKIIVNK